MPPVCNKYELWRMQAASACQDTYNDNFHQHCLFEMHSSKLFSGDLTYDFSYSARNNAELDDHLARKTFQTYADKRSLIATM